MKFKLQSININKKILFIFFYLSFFCSLLIKANLNLNSNEVKVKSTSKRLETIRVFSNEIDDLIEEKNLKNLKKEIQKNNLLKNSFSKRIVQHVQHKIEEDGKMKVDKKSKDVLNGRGKASNSQSNESSTTTKNKMGFQYAQAIKKNQISGISSVGRIFSGFDLGYIYSKIKNIISGKNENEQKGGVGVGSIVIKNNQLNEGILYRKESIVKTNTNAISNAKNSNIKSNIANSSFLEKLEKEKIISEFKNSANHFLHPKFQ